MNPRTSTFTGPFPRINRILFATDFSSYSRKARNYTATLARALQVEVIVFHAMAELELPGMEQDEELKRWCRRLEGKMQEKLQNTVGYFQKHDIPVRGELKWGSAWQEILALAETEDAGMIVVGSHRITSADDQVRLGTTSHRLALASPVPVLIVRPDEEIPI